MEYMGDAQWWNNRFMNRSLDLMSHDKKVEDGRLRLVLLEAVGKAVLSDKASEAQIMSAIAKRLPNA